jgi:hypothetical protein
MKGVLFLDVDGVLNQYNRAERIRRVRTKGFMECLDPFQKKVKRLHKLVKKYNLDVYVFSAWNKEDLQFHLPFELKGDTRKRGDTTNEISLRYDFSILVDDEASAIFDKKDRYNLSKDIILYQPNGDFGLVLVDFIKLDNILSKV